MNRYFAAIQAVHENVPIASLADGFAHAVHEVEAEGREAESCPAVLVLGALIAFRTQGDVLGPDALGRAIEECQHRIQSRSIQ